MSDITLQRNLGSLVSVRRASASAAQTAAGSGDNTSVTGTSVDRAAIGLPLSAVFATLFDATLASGETLSVATTVLHSTDNSSFTDYATEASTVVGTGPSGGGVVTGQREVSVDLSSAYRYVRADHKPDLSRGGTDTSVTRGVAVFGGGSPLPQ